MDGLCLELEACAAVCILNKYFKQYNMFKDPYWLEDG